MSCSDNPAVPVAGIPAVGESFVKTVSNKTANVVVNGLLAAYHAKAQILQVLGPGGITSGTTGVERNWWQQELHNDNMAAVWATLAYLQYRSTVLWVGQVRSKLRSLTGTLGNDLQASRIAEELVDIRNRPVLRCTNSQPAAVSILDLNYIAGLHVPQG